MRQDAPDICTSYTLHFYGDSTDGFEDGLVKNHISRRTPPRTAPGSLAHEEHKLKSGYYSHASKSVQFEILAQSSGHTPEGADYFMNFKIIL